MSTELFFYPHLFLFKLKKVRWITESFLIKKQSEEQLQYVLLPIFETFPLDSGSAIRYAWNDKEESKEVRLFFTWVNLVETETQTTEVQSF